MALQNSNTEYLTNLHAKKVVVAISGKSGCGNTTVTRLLADRLELNMINYTFRNLADEEGVSLMDILQKARSDDSLDRRVDNRQVELARAGNCVLGSRLAIWVYPEADLRVYLTANLNTRAQRIHQREGGDYENVLAETQKRDREDRQRYMDLYGIDNDDFRFADLVIDVSDILPESIVEHIIIKLNDKLDLTRFYSGLKL